VVFLGDGQVVGELADPTAEAVLDQLKRLDPGGSPAPGEPPPGVG
jgi:putative ABC transport system ATP-binding protein